MSPRIGDPAPDFTLPGTGERNYSLAEYRGRPVVLVFYPGDDTPVPGSVKSGAGSPMRRLMRSPPPSTRR